MTTTQKPVVVENSAPMKAIVVLAAALFGAVGLGGVAGGVFSDLHPFLRVMFAAIGAGSLWLAAIFATLMRYLEHRLELGDDGIRLIHRDSAVLLPWPSVRHRARDALQVVDLLDDHGRRLYSVDYWAPNVDVLLQRLAERPGLDGGAGRRRDSSKTVASARGAGSLNGWGYYAFFATLSLVMGLGILVSYDVDSGVVPEADLLTAQGTVAWVQEYKYGTRFGLEGVTGNFNYPSKANGMGAVRDALASAGSAIVTVRYEADAHGPVASDMRYHGVWELVVDDRVIRSYAVTLDEWRGDNRVAPWLGAFFTFSGALLAMMSWLARDHAARRRRA